MRKLSFIERAIRWAGKCLSIGRARRLSPYAAALRAIEEAEAAYRALARISPAVQGVPETVAVTLREGGQWLLMSDVARLPAEERTVHSIMFSNDTIWDATNGWRKRK